MRKFPDDYVNKIICGGCIETLMSIPDKTVQTCITSPPYWGLRDYGVAGQLGQEATPEKYVDNMVVVFDQVRRVLKDDGTLWLNLGDCYAGSGKGGQSHEKRSKNWQPKYANSGNVPDGLKPKDLVGIPFMVAFALRSAGWYLRCDIIWSKPNPMPESVTDRPTRSHEYIFLLSKSSQYYYDADSIRTPMRESSVARLSQNVDGQTGSDRANAGEKTNGPMKAVRRKKRGHEQEHTGFRDNWDNLSKEEQQAGGANKRSVWEVATMPFKQAHFATFPVKLIEPCIIAGSRAGDIVLDPFSGAGTTAFRSKELSRKHISIDINPDYCKIAEQRLAQEELF